jgi:hypothetical protein
MQSTLKLFQREAAVVGGVNAPCNEVGSARR